MPARLELGLWPRLIVCGNAVVGKCFAELAPLSIRIGVASVGAQLANLLQPPLRDTGRIEFSNRFLEFSRGRCGWRRRISHSVGCYCVLVRELLRWNGNPFTLCGCRLR